jgi:hypothetical protein
VSPIIDTADYVRPTSAATILGVTRDCIHKRIAAGTLQAVTIDGHLFLDRASVEAIAGPVSRPRGGGTRRPRTPAARGRVSGPGTTQTRRSRRGTAG